MAVLPILLGVAIGALLGGGLAWLACSRRAGRAKAAEPDADVTRRLRHDVRGALAPAMLAADRLGSHPDEEVRRVSELIIRALERGADLLKKPG